MSGFFISFEGLDGAGKTTQIGLLEELLVSRGERVLVTREPGGTSIGEVVRDVLLSVNNRGMDINTETLLYAAARAQLVSEVILPKLSEGYIVLCDRFIDSSVAYQGFGRGLPTDMVLGVNEYAVSSCMPDLTFYICVDGGLSFDRKYDMVLDRIEGEDLDFFSRVARGYEMICADNPDRVVWVDGSLSIDEVFGVVSDAVLRLIRGQDC